MGMRSGPKRRRRRNKMIDFHTHILPEMDDGSKSVAESLAMLREESRQGVQAIALTPHFYADENSPQQFLKRREAAWEKLKPNLEEGMPRLYLGAEVQYFEGIGQVNGICDLCIEGTQLFLLEMPFRQWSDRMLSNVLELKEQENIQVVLAHIERYLPWQPKGIWQELIRCGIRMQVNASFFNNWKTRRKAMRMLDRGEIHILGSDCHNMANRPPNLGRAYQFIGHHVSNLHEVL